MFVKKFSHIAPPVSIEELKTVQTANGRFYLAPGKKNYPSVTTVCGWEKNNTLPHGERRIPKKPPAHKSVATRCTKRARTTSTTSRLERSSRTKPCCFTI